MAVPYTFGSATTSIPLSQLDSNFATTITLGNTAIQLGNTVTTLNNMTLASPTLTTPALGTPASGVMTNVTAIPAAQITGSQAIPKGTLPTGSVLQVVGATYSTTVTTSSSTAVSSNLTATITPTSSSSKIYVMVVNPMRRNDVAGITFGIAVSLFRNGSGLFTPMTNMGYSNSVSNMAVSWLVGFNYLDSPATTSATTYTMYFNCATTGMSCSSCVDSNPATITLMEIAA